jgi:MFS family permease
MFTILRQRNFALLWWGQLISAIGDWMLRIALPIYVYDQTGSALGIGTMFIVQTLPRVLFGSLAGVFVDRWNRKRTMVISDLAQTVLVLLLLIGSSPERLWVIYLVAEPQLVAANSLNALSQALIFLIGPSLGGVVMELLGMSSVVLLNSASFLVSGAMISLISVSSYPPEQYFKTADPGTTVTATWTTMWQEWLEGLRLVKREFWLISLFIVMGVAAFAQGIINVLFVIFVREVLKAGALEFGWLVAIQGIGGLIGGFIVGQVGKSLQPSRLIILGELMVGLIFVTIFSFPSLLLALILSALLAIPATGYQVGTQTLLQSKVADRYRGRIFGTRDTTSALLMLGGLGLASVLGDVLGAMLILKVAGGLFFFAGVIALVLLRRDPGS